MISAQDVKKLRDVTGAGMMDCKKALTEANGDFEAAIDILRKKGQKVSAKRADRDANEGVISSALSSDGKVGVMIEVNCETDFVARNEEFQAFADKLVNIAIDNTPADLDALKNVAFEGGRSIGDALTDMTGKIGEKIDVRRYTLVGANEGQIVAYIHPGSRLGVLVEMTGEGNLEEAGKDVAMQVAAMDPVSVRVEDVPEEVREKELEIGRETARNEGKPENLLDNIAQGKLKRFYKDNVLLEQSFVKDAQMTVGQMLKQSKADITRFIRFQLGG